MCNLEQQSEALNWSGSSLSILILETSPSVTKMDINLIIYSSLNTICLEICNRLFNNVKSFLKESIKVKSMMLFEYLNDFWCL
jgi:hypothetical protein